MERHLAAILAADVVGYSRLMEQDEADTFERLRTHRRELFEPEIEKHHGRIFKLIGDGLLAEFGSVVDAVECAVTLQRGMAERNTGVADGQRIDVRIGINLGDVIIDGEDRHGEGVNIAARLQELAAAGGICVSGKVAKEVERKLAFQFDSMGDHRVKNIAEPVSVFSVRFDGAIQLARPSAKRTSAQRLSWSLAGAAALAVLVAAAAGLWHFYLKPGLPLAANSEPSLAVLPFANMSGDQSQDYLGPGIAEDIITVLSSYPGIQVVSRTSSFIYDKPVKVQQVSTDLGVAYVLEGSVKKEAGKLRVTAQLIDAKSGIHVWAERFDRAGDIFVLQEDVANLVYDSLAGLRGAIRNDEARTAWSKSAPRLEEYDYYLRGHQYFFQWTAEGVARAREIWQEGLAKYPDSGLLRIKLAATYVNDILNERSADPAADAAAGWELLEEARAKPDLSRFEQWLLHWLSARLLTMHLGDFKRAVAEAEAAMAMVPYDAFAHADLGEVLMNAGEPDRAVEWLENAIRHDPRPMPWFYNSLALALYNAGRIEDALAQLEKAPEPSNWTLAAVYSRLGRVEDAKTAVARILERCPSCTVADEAVFPTGRQPQMVEPYLSAYLDDLRKAGLPEK